MPTALAPMAAQNLADRIADRLVEAIAWGELRAGERLVEGELAARLGVSRIPLREAIRTLEAQAIVQSEPHRGARVASFGDGWADQVRRARIALERLAFRDAARSAKGDPALARDLDRLVAAMAENAPHDLLAVIRADVAFHRRVVQASGDPIIRSLWEALARHTLIVFGRETRAFSHLLDHAGEHGVLRDLVVAGDLVELEAEVERHILRIPGLMAQHVSIAEEP